MRGSWAHTAPEGCQPCPIDNASRYVMAQVSRWLRTDEPIHPESAMEIAAWYHGSARRDRAITAFSHSGIVMIDALLPNIRRIMETDVPMQRTEEQAGQRAATSALLAYVSDVVDHATRYRRHLWSAAGHRFMGSGSDDPDQESCLTCGGEWVLRPDSADGDYGSYFGLGADGPELAMQCSGRTDLEHGPERHCQASNGSPCDASAAYDGSGPDCEHIEHECNCLLCQ